MRKRIIKMQDELYYIILKDKKFYTKKNNIAVTDFNKEHTKYIAFKWMFISMTVFFALSVYYNISGGIPLKNVDLYTNMLGKDCIIQIDEIGSSTVSLNFDGNIVNGLEYCQKITANVSSNVLSCNLKAKAYISLLQGMQDVEIYGYTNWQKNQNDKYIVYNQTVLGGENVGVCLYVKMPEEVLFDSNRIYILTIVVEAY